MSEEVQQMFNRIARRYDVANDALSFGIHRLWRKQLVRMAEFANDATVIDLCTGTGDLAFDIARSLGPQGNVLAYDFSREMLEVAAKKETERSGPEKAAVTFSFGDALSIPLSDATADGVTISFGIRNVDDLDACLKEMKRLLKPRGKAMVLEFGQPYLPGFQSLYRLYSKHIMPRIGGMLTGDKAAYSYLPETASRYPCGIEFAERMKAAGFKNVSFKACMFGIAYIYQGQK